MQPVKHDPAPSRWAWRLERLMLTPGVRPALRAGLPFLIAMGVGSWYLSQEHVQTRITETYGDLRTSIEERPEFMVNLMAIDGADAELATAIRGALNIKFPVSSFDLSLDSMRHQIAQMDPVKSVSMRIRSGGILQVDVEPRVPVVIWRAREGLILLDDTGAPVAGLATRAARADLPLIAGERADAEVAEALALRAAAEPLGDRLRGFVRMGERRWDVVLDRDQRIMLPETGAVEALERVIALDMAGDLLGRDISRVDMRLGQRPTLRMEYHASSQRWRSLNPLSVNPLSE